MKLVGFAIYLGIGALLHAVFIGPQFDWTSAWTFGWLLGWPIMLLISFWALIIGVAIVAGFGIAILAWIESIANWRARRRASKRKSNSPAH